MRVTRLIAVAAVAGCAFGARAADVGAGAAAEPERLQSIDVLEASCADGVLTVTATVTTESLGWKQTRLHQTEATNETITFEAVGIRPEVSAQAQEHVRLASQANVQKGVARVHVDAKTNTADAEVAPAC